MIAELLGFLQVDGLVGVHHHAIALGAVGGNQAATDIEGHQFGVAIDAIAPTAAAPGDEGQRVALLHLDVVAFGLVVLEAIQHGTPALISKQSGVSEVMTHVLKVDFWDIEEMANKIVALLRYAPLDQQLTLYGKEEARKLSWGKAATRVLRLYEQIVSWFIKSSPEK